VKKIAPPSAVRRGANFGNIVAAFLWVRRQSLLPLMDFDDDCFVVIVDCCILL
jgi:hypothetical protein